MCEMDLFFLLSIIYHMTFDIIIIEGAQIKFYCVHSTIFINTQLVLPARSSNKTAQG